MLKRSQLSQGCFLILILHLALPSCLGQPLAAEADYRFGALAWMQRSAEYQLLAKQSYRLALTQLTIGLNDRKWSADEAQLAEGGFENKQPAVILDVDETVLDNTAFNARMLLQGKGFTAAEWNAWCLESKADPVPGALEFINSAQGLGVAVFFITNREDLAKEATIKNLKQLGIKANSENVLTHNPSAGRNGDKVSRRAAVAAAHRIVLLIGDNLGDLCDGVELTDYVRRNEVAKVKSEMLGTRWIVIPNPLYGGWLRALPGGAAALETKSN
jgi:5'-nucleotidase (lipoprotein e(P4) family)